MIRPENSTSGTPQIDDVEQISQEARVAISRGIQRGDAVAEMEMLGLSLRTINILEESRFQIIRLSELVSLQRNQLLEISNFGEHGLYELMDCLSRYYLLDRFKERFESKSK
jgi:DNA-directed RNA polymerase alpha subunit